MPIESLIDVENGCIIRKVTGDLTFEDTRKALEESYEDPDFKPGMPVVWDIREGSIANTSPDEFRKIAQHVIKQTQKRGGGYKAAFVAPLDLEFDLFKLHIVFFVDLPVSIEPFREFDDAIEWIKSG